MDNRHTVGQPGDLDACTAKGGPLEALVEAREEALVRWLGITGHTHDAPRTHLEALRRFDFDTVRFPLNFVLSKPVTTLCSVGDVTVLPKLLAAAERFRPLNPAEEGALAATATRYHSPFVGEWA